MMDSSPIFKLCFWGAIATLTAAMIMGVIVPFADCRTYTYRSCSWWNSSYFIECYRSYVTYCCTNSYSYCGDYYCYLKP